MFNQDPSVLTLDNEDMARKSFNHMNAIALGVEARYDLLTGYLRTVIETTVQTARQLGIPEEEIQWWKVTSSEAYSKVKGSVTPGLI